MQSCKLLLHGGSQEVDDATMDTNALHQLIWQAKSAGFTKVVLGIRKSTTIESWDGTLALAAILITRRLMTQLIQLSTQRHIRGVAESSQRDFRHDVEPFHKIANGTSWKDSKSEKRLNRASRGMEPNYSWDACRAVSKIITQLRFCCFKAAIACSIIKNGVFFAKVSGPIPMPLATTCTSHWHQLKSTLV